MASGLNHYGFSILSACIGSAIAVLALGGLGSAVPCPAAPVTDLFDYQGDVMNTSRNPWFEEAGHADVDILEVVSCVSGPDMVLGLRVAGAIEDGDERVEYTFIVRGPGILGDNVYFQNGTANYLDSETFDEVSLNNTTAADWLTVYYPLAAYGSAAGGWSVRAKSGFDTNDNGYLDFMDEATLETGQEFGDVDDFSLESSPFSTPSVSITSLTVAREGAGFRLTVEGTAQGPVAELRVAMATELRASGSSSSTYSWPGYYWTAESFEGGTPNVSLEKVGGSWATWRFERVYTGESLKGLFSGSPLFSVVGAKVEVRAIAQDGRWGHVNQTFNPTAVSQPAGGGSSGSMLIIGVGIAAAVGVIAAVLMVRKRKKPAATPPGAGTPPTQPGPPPT